MTPKPDGVHMWKQTWGQSWVNLARLSYVCLKDEGSLLRLGALLGPPDKLCNPKYPETMGQSCHTG